MSNPIVIITSVIHIKRTINIKSYCDDNIRLQQTLNTIETVKKYLPNSYILLSEGSTLTEEEYEKLSSLVNHVLLIDSPDITKGKSIGELRILIESMNYINSRKLEYNKIYKLSGRYWLNESFDDTKYSESLYTFKLRRADSYFVRYVLYGREVITFLFCVPRIKSKEFYQLITGIHYKLTNLVFFKFMNIETCMFLSIDDSEINYINRLGCSGKSGPSGLLVDD